MPDSWKCVGCGVVNLASDASCKRCAAPRDKAGMPTQPLAAGIVLPDGYVLPPPPAIGGVWRDNQTLILTKDASLPDQCVKCNAPANGYRLKRKLSWHPPVLYLLLLLAWLIYVLVAAALSKRATVYLGLCTEHFERRRNLLIVGWALLAIGLITPVIAFSNDLPGIALAGFLMLFVSIIWLVAVSRVVKVKKIDDQLVWLGGIDPNYLSQFPVWQHQM